MILIYDVESIPQEAGLEMEKVMEIADTKRLVLWTSRNGGVEPKVYSKSDLEEMRIVDLKSMSIDEFNNTMNQNGES